MDIKFSEKNAACTVAIRLYRETPIIMNMQYLR